MGALSGNVSPNRAALSFTITGLSIANGATFWLRWADTDLIPGADDGLSVDDFSLTPSGTIPVVDLAPVVSSTVPADAASEILIDSNVSVTFSEPVDVASDWFTINCITSGVRDVANTTVSGGPTAFSIDPNSSFAYGETCTLTVIDDKVTDQDANDPPDAMEADFTASFTTVADVCTLAFTPIYSIQGSGATVALTGTRTTQGVVVGDYEGASPALRGFFIQDPTGDADPATSDGIFVFEGSNADTVNLGDVVRVTGTAGENQGQSQISVPSANPIINCGTGTVTPTDVKFPVASADFLEQYEGMLVRLPQTMYVTEIYQLGRFDEVLMSARGRLMQPTNIYAPGPDADALQAENNLNQILIDDGTNAQNPDPILFARGGLPLSASNTLRGGDTATGIVGVLNYTWGGNSASPNAYRVRPINALGGYVNFEATNPRPDAAPTLAGRLRVAGMNLLNYFNTFDGASSNPPYACRLGVGGALTDCRGADDPGEFARQWPKTVAAIVGTNADVVGLVEMENDGYGSDSTIQDLINKLNVATAPGTYAFIDADAGTSQVNALGTDAIKVGLIYKPSRAIPVGTTAVLNTEAFVNGGDTTVRNRPALAQAFEEIGTGEHFVVAVNHLKSKGSACDAPDAGDGQGNCNAVRTNAANELWSWLAGDPTQTGDPDALIIGDLNSYAMEDPITALKDVGYTDLKLFFGSKEAYSYVFDGQWGYLDHALSSTTLTQQVAAVFDWHINADEPSVLDYNTNFKSTGQIIGLYALDEFRIADHDPVLIDMDLNSTTTESIVTAGGWIDSPTGAYALEPAAHGKAFIPFNIKYKKGNLAPTGNLQFTLMSSTLNFRSTRYDWLVVHPSGTSAQFKGQGVIGTQPCQFMVWVGDGAPDTYRIKIWYVDAGGTHIVYDNGALQPVGAGSIQINTK